MFRERLLNPKMFKKPADEAVIRNVLDNTMPECLRYLESQIPASGYLIGDSLSIADIAVTTCFIQARYGDFEVDGAVVPRLRSYLDRAFAAPLVTTRLAAERAAMPPGLL